MVTVAMETRQLRKRRWQSSSGKKSRASLDFTSLDRTPLPKKRRLRNKDVQDLIEDDPESFNTRSFYGKREKKNFPHSPKRRKAAEEILAKISDENSESSADDRKMPEFDYHATDSAETDSDTAVKPVLKQRNQRVVRKAQTPKAYIRKESPARSMSDSKCRKQVRSETPDSSGKKFFKHRSPVSSLERVVGKGSIVVRKGFDLKFHPRRLSDSSIEKSTSVKKSKPTPKQRKVKAVQQISEGIDDIVFCSTINKQLTAEKNSKTQKTSVHLEFNEDNLLDHSEPVVEAFADDVSDGLFSELIESCPATPEPSLTNASTSPSLTNASTSPSPSSLAGDSVSSGPVVNPKRMQNGQQLFPIFTRSGSKPTTPQSNNRTLSRLRSSRGSSTNSPLLRHTKSKDNTEQLTIDAGQKRFGATQCEVCGMVYTVADPMDETTHLQFHRSLLNALKFTGWKKERVVQEYIDTGSRVIMVTSDAPNYATRKVEEINKIMGEELGFPEPTLAFRENYKAFLYISDEKRIEGCCVAEPVSEGYRVLPESQSSQQPGHRPWCCSSAPEKAMVGISRIWVYSQQRKKGIASRLLDCVRQWFAYGCVIKRKYVAFSDPTPDGKILATKYFGTPEFLVYKFS